MYNRHHFIPPTYCAFVWNLGGAVVGYRHPNILLPDLSPSDHFLFTLTCRIVLAVLQSRPFPLELPFLIYLPFFIIAFASLCLIFFSHPIILVFPPGRRGSIRSL